MPKKRIDDALLINRKKTKEIVSYNHCNIDVKIMVDYEKQTVSLIERDRYESVKPKQWVFWGRTPEYRLGWQTILTAMSRAIDYGFNLITEEEEYQKKLFEQRLDLKVKEVGDKISAH